MYGDEGSRSASRAWIPSVRRTFADLSDLPGWVVLNLMAASEATYSNVGIRATCKRVYAQG